MASVNCYLPDALKARAERELPATVSWSEILRRGILAALDGDAQAAGAAPSAAAGTVAA